MDKPLPVLPVQTAQEVACHRCYYFAARNCKGWVMGGTHGDACEQCLVGHHIFGHQRLNADSTNSKLATSVHPEGAGCLSSDLSMSVSVRRSGFHDCIDDWAQGANIHMGSGLW